MGSAVRYAASVAGVDAGAAEVSTTRMRPWPYPGDATEKFRCLAIGVAAGSPQRDVAAPHPPVRSYSTRGAFSVNPVSWMSIRVIRPRSLMKLTV